MYGNNPNGKTFSYYPMYKRQYTQIFNIKRALIVLLQQSQEEQECVYEIAAAVNERL